MNNIHKYLNKIIVLSEGEEGYMKLICDCGNEQEFNTIDKETGQQTSYTDGEGQYTTIDSFEFWQRHDVVGICCSKCKKAIWLFT